MNQVIGPATLPEKSPGTIRISCIGDSITQGYLSSDEELKSYPGQLQRLINDSRVEVHNFGRNGATMKKSGFKPYWSLPEYSQAIASSPDIAFIMLGTNDANPLFNGVELDKEEYINDYRELIKILKALPSKPEIRLITSVPLNKPFAGMNQTLINTDLHQYVREVAKLEGIPDEHIVDGFNKLGGQEKSRFELFCNGQACDGCHPNDSGYMELTAAVYNNLFMSDDTRTKLLKKTFDFNNYSQFREYQDQVIKSYLDK